MLSKISSPTCGIPRLMILSMLKIMQKRATELASKQQMMLLFPSINPGKTELPDYPVHFKNAKKLLHIKHFANISRICMRSQNVVQFSKKRM